MLTQAVLLLLLLIVTVPQNQALSPGATVLLVWLVVTPTLIVSYPEPTVLLVSHEQAHSSPPVELWVVDQWKVVQSPVTDIPVE